MNSESDCYLWFHDLYFLLMCLNGSNIEVSHTVCNLRVTLDQTLAFQQHTSNVCPTCYLELPRISRIRHHLSKGAIKSVKRAFVLSRLDYCNALLASSPKHLLDSSKQYCSAHLPVFQIQPYHTSSPYSTLAPNWKKGSISNSVYFALNLWLVLSSPTSRTFFIVTLLFAAPFFCRHPSV